MTEPSAPLPAATLAECAEAVLLTQDPWKKAALSRLLATHWLEAETKMAIGAATPPAEPARPEKPELLDPRKMPKRSFGGQRGQAALLHAIAHIELNAIDLHWDIIARFSHEPMPPSFYDDWALAASQEAKHFQLLTARLSAMGYAYGDFPAHAGLWRSASATAADLLGRLAVVPMVLEARGLDVTPSMIAQFRDIDDLDTVAALEVIYAEEVAHVAYGSKWFHFLCGRNDTDPRDAFHELVRLYFGGSLKPPFNEEKRAEAGLPPDFYWPLVESSGKKT